MIESKNIWESKTFWTQLLAVLASCGTLFGLDIDPATQADLIVGIMGFQALLTTIFRATATARIKLPSANQNNK